MEEQLKISYSRISKHRQCPKAFAFNYIEGYEDHSGKAAKAGNFIHDALEDLFENSPDARTFDELGNWMGDNWDKYFEELTEYYKETNQKIDFEEEEHKQFIWNAAVNLWNLEDPENIKVIGTEIDFEVEVEGALLRGYIDRVIELPTGSIRIDDYKSGKMGKDEYLSEKVAQILLYAIAYQMKTGILPEYGRLIFLNEGIVEVKFTQDSIAEMWKFLRRNIKAIRTTFEKGTDQASAKVGPLCAWCSYIDKCPKGQAHFERSVKFGKVRWDAPAFSILDFFPDIEFHTNENPNNLEENN